MRSRHPKSKIKCLSFGPEFGLRECAKGSKNHTFMMDMFCKSLDGILPSLFPICRVGDLKESTYSPSKPGVLVSCDWLSDSGFRGTLDRRVFVRATG